MAMSESTPAPPYGAVANKDNTHQGECESDENQGNEDGSCEIDPADLEDGEILDDSGGEEPRIKESVLPVSAAVSLEKIMLNNPIGDSETGKKKKKKKPKRPASVNEDSPKKRKKYERGTEEDPFFERGSSPASRARGNQKRHREGTFGSSRLNEKSSSFDEEIAAEERRHLKQGTKLPVHQRLGSKVASRTKGRSSSGSSRPLGLGKKRGSAIARPPLRKREPRPKPLCKFFLDGNCNKGAMCTFSHDTTPFKKRDLCKFYLNGYCAKEDACLFMHDDFPCKFFHTGAVCYADSECRFSHKPLTDEGKMLLARYLDSCHSMPKMDRRREHSPPPMRMDRGRPSPNLHPPMHHPNNNNNNNNMMNDVHMKMNQRPSLLGSPPRHIKEAASEWQQDLRMQMHQLNDKSPPHPHMGRPNFYMDTMENSPQRDHRDHRDHMHGNSMRNDPEAFQMGDPFIQAPNCGDLTPTQGGGTTPIPTDDEAEGDTNDRSTCLPPMQVRFFQQKQMQSETEDSISAVISAIRAESECQRTPPHLEVERSLSPSSRPDVNDQPPDLLAGSPPTLGSSPKDEGKDESKEESEELGIESTEEAQNQAASEEAPPIIFPSHLPRKQRELFMRIQQHQRLGAKKGGSSTDDTEDQTEEKTSEDDLPEITKEDTSVVPAVENVEVKAKEEPVEVATTSVVKEEEEEDEDTEDEDMEERPKKWYSSDEDDDENGDQPLTDVLKRLQQMPPPMSRPPATAATTSPAPAIDIAKMLSSIREQATQSAGLSSGLKSDFWQNILSATAPPPNLPPAATEPELQRPRPHRDPRCRDAPQPQKLVPPTPLNVEKSLPRTLSARDPRLSRSVSKTEVENPIVKIKSPDRVPVKEEKAWVKEERVWESASRERDKKSSQSTYRLHTVTVLPLNYSSYLFATQNDTKLLEDPRLKKLLSSQTSPRPMASLPFPPELQQFLEQAEPKPKQSPPSVIVPPPPPLVVPPAPVRATNLILGSGSSTVQKSDPRLKRSPAASAQSPVHSGGFTPPHPANPMMEFPPNPHPGGFTPPHPVNHHMMDMPPNPLIMGFPIPHPMNPMMDMGHPPMPPNPMLHTHMPRGFIDPRFTRLQQPMNPRRGGRGPSLRHPGPPRKMKEINKTLPVPQETKNSEPIKSETDGKSLRKTQMDYTSPLSAYDESTPSDGSAYNRRPQIKPRTVNTPLPAASLATTAPPALQTSIPNVKKMDSITDNLEMPSQDVNEASVRDVFKTIDPTASPFC